MALAAASPADAQGPLAEWSPFVGAPGAVDVVGPRRDGRFVVSRSQTPAGQEQALSLFRPGEGLTPFASGPNGYSNPDTQEPYIALSGGGQVRGANCSFARGDLFVLEADATPRVLRVKRSGRASGFAELDEGVFPSGIAFDTGGRFGGRLLVTGVVDASTTTLYAIDCRGRVRTFLEGAPRVEGGIEVAPRSFAPYDRWLIAADEHSGRVVGFLPRGASVIADSGLPFGADVGVESVGFVPPGFGPGDAAYLADYDVGINTPGSGAVLSVSAASLAAAGVVPGDLLIATEAGAETIVLRCAPQCAATVVATGPDIAHAEGHISFGPAP